MPAAFILLTGEGRAIPFAAISEITERDDGGCTVWWNVLPLGVRQFYLAPCSLERAVALLNAGAAELP